MKERKHQGNELVVVAWLQGGGKSSSLASSSCLERVCVSLFITCMFDLLNCSTNSSSGTFFFFFLCVSLCVSLFVCVFTYRHSSI